MPYNQNGRSYHMGVFDRHDPLITMFIQKNRDLFLNKECKLCWLKFHTYFSRFHSQKT